MTAPAASPRRCTRARLSRSTCDLCVASCPRDAVSLEPLPRIDVARCSGCEACVAACPLDALAGGGPRAQALASRLRAVDNPVIGCTERGGGQGHALVPCLAALGLSDLVGLAAAVPHRIVLNATHCSGCLNERALRGLRARLGALREHGLDQRFELVDSGDLHVKPRQVPRRGLLRALLQESVGFAGRPTPPDAEASAAGRHVPASCVDLESALRRLPSGVARGLRPVTTFRAVVRNDCDACGRCAAICPTGALVRQRGSESRALDFVESLCVGCDACAEFCPSRSIQIEPATIQASQPRERIAERALHQETVA